MYHYLIGTDEAGYGPNLGPLTVSATVWRVPLAAMHTNLYDVLSGVATPEREKGDDARVWISDSKRLYKPRQKNGLASLELGVLAALNVAKTKITQNVSWRKLSKAVSAQDHRRLLELPWYTEFDDQLPIDADPSSVQATTQKLAAGLASADVELTSVCTRTISAREFNALLQQHGNKSAVLSHVTIGLIANQLSGLKPEPVTVLCDKHGGRDRYAALLQSQFDDFVQVLDEGRSQSVYRLNTGGREIQFCFQAKADNILAAGLASMVSKYVRELAMRAFNRFWVDQKSDLKPTAGYPLDAKRFKEQIATVQAGLGIEDDDLWRQR